ncbi:hypothetical protein [Streptomyces sp. URMC 123]|uniref:hypothetical protein n=1 Tax=Streptomyces sp. URMC 123 TaxID=3423403 RepID=UPI003F1A9511
MEAVAASVIAVLGTLLGAGVTHVFQRRAMHRTERFTRDEKLRQERLDAYSGYAGALVDYRRSLMERWLERHEAVPFDDDEPALRARSYALRTRAEEALFRLQMITDDEELIRCSRDVLRCVGEIHKARDRAEWDIRRTSAKTAIHDFVAAARRSLS